MRVSVDVGSQRHRVAIGLSTGEVWEECDIAHAPEGFRHFCRRMAAHEEAHAGRVSVAMEGFHGYARPLGRRVRARNYRLYTIKNLKLARVKEICPGAAHTDAIDARQGLALFPLRDHLPLATEALQEVAQPPEANGMLKRLTRRRRWFGAARGWVLNPLQGALQAVCPGVGSLTKEAGHLGVLRLLISAQALPKLARLRPKTL